MTKIESARIIVRQEGNCLHPFHLLCKDCFNLGKCNIDLDCFGEDQRLKDATTYIKRHESKSKKKDHIRDTTKKVESTAISYEPCVSCRNNHGLCSTKERTANVENCVSYEPIDIEKNYFKKKVEEPKPAEEPTPLEIAKIIRDNDYSCNGILCVVCPLYSLPKCGSCCSTSEDRETRIKLIDDYISANEPTVKENLSVPQPIKIILPEYVYTVSPTGILRRNVRAYAEIQKDEEENLVISGEKCYRTPEEALQVAKKLWQGEGK